jgi:hypothetical protein
MVCHAVLRDLSLAGLLEKVSAYVREYPTLGYLTIEILCSDAPFDRRQWLAVIRWKVLPSSTAQGSIT